MNNPLGVSPSWFRSHKRKLFFFGILVLSPTAGLICYIARSRKDCLFGRLLNDIIRGAYFSESDRHRCITDKRIRLLFPNIYSQNKTFSMLRCSRSANTRQKASCLILLPVSTLYACNARDYDTAFGAQEPTCIL